jgi:hypothetical protein
LNQIDPQLLDLYFKMKKITTAAAAALTSFSLHLLSVAFLYNGEEKKIKLNESHS